MVFVKRKRKEFTICGLVGIAGNLEFRDEAALKRLLLFDYFRGTDSTGVAFLNKNTGQSDIVKIASHPLDLFDSKKFQDHLHAHRCNVFLGHNRAATKGKVNGLNAHPFECGDIIGCHNGTLSTTSWRELESDLGFQTEVDSKAIFEHINKFGIEKTVPKLQGAWALTFIDNSDPDVPTLNFIRNDQRPFWVAMTKDHKKLLWASEWPIIQAAVEMDTSQNGYVLHEDKEGYTFFPTEVDHLYTFKVDEMAKGSKDWPDANKRLLKGKEPAPVVSYAGAAGGNPFMSTTTTTQTSTTTKNSTTSLGAGAADNQPKEILITVPGDQPLGSFVAPDYFKNITKRGCEFCQEPVRMEDEGIVFFESIDAVLCGSCSGRTTTRVMATPKTFSAHL